MKSATTAVIVVKMPNNVAVVDRLALPPITKCVTRKVLIDAMTRTQTRLFEDRTSDELKGSIVQGLIDLVEEGTVKDALDSILQVMHSLDENSSLWKSDKAMLGSNLSPASST